MKTHDIRTHLNSCRAAVTGEYASATRVIDALLDVRLLAAGNPVLTKTVDGSLKDVPGYFVAPNDWWVSQLDQIELALSAEMARTVLEPVEPVGI